MAAGTLSRRRSPQRLQSEPGPDRCRGEIRRRFPPGRDGPTAGAVIPGTPPRPSIPAVRTSRRNRPLQRRRIAVLCTYGARTGYPAEAAAPAGKGQQWTVKYPDG
jgi:hypothetical protein